MEFVLGLIESGGFAFTAYTLYKLQQKQLKIHDLISFLQKSTVLSPAMLVKAMEANGAGYLVRNVKEFEEGKNYSRGLAMVQGLVDSEQIIRSILNHSTKLVLSSVSSELIFSNNKNFEEADGRIDTKFVSEFKLTDPSSSKDNIVLNSTSNVQYGDSLHLIHSIVHMRSLSPLEKFLSWILFCIKLFLSMSNVGKRLSGFKVGTKRVERGIMIGQFMIAFGEVIYDRFNKELRMSNPLFFLKDKEQLINKLKDKRIQLGKNMTLFFAVMIFLAFLVVKRSTKIAGFLYQKYKQLSQLKNPDKFFSLKKINTSDFKCYLCSENVRNVIFKPCLHLEVCSTCFDKLPDKKCPLCKQEVKDRVNVFVV
jgi:hypothetical protein